MDKTTLDQVKEFHEAFGHPVSKEHNILDRGVNKLRIELLEEELGELKNALADKDIVEVLDALLDLQYVLDGAFLTFGLHKVKTEAFNEVHRSNMSKLGEDGKPIYREDGKILKGPDYFKPNLMDYVIE